MHLKTKKRQYLLNRVLNTSLMTKVIFLNIVLNSVLVKIYNVLK